MRTFAYFFSASGPEPLNFLPRLIGTACQGRGEESTMTKTLNEELDALRRAVGCIYGMDRALLSATPDIACNRRRSRVRTALKAHARQVRSYGHRIQRIATEIQSKYGQLSELACTDPLTALPNRRAMMERLVEEVQRARRQSTSLSVIMLDIDDFKQINDTLGHQAGDSALIEVATAISSVARAYDVAARYGGDEFMIILPGADAATARSVADRIDAAIATVSNFPRTLQASIGVASLRPEAPDESALIEEADRALYATKRAKQQRSVHVPVSPYLF